MGSRCEVKLPHLPYNMHLNALLCLSTAIVATLAKPVADWKTAAGWDGEILTVNDIGSTLYESSELEVRHAGDFDYNVI